MTCIPKKDSVCSERIQKWVYWWASNYASPGLTVLGSRRPGPPAPAQAGTRGAIREDLAGPLVEDHGQLLVLSLAVQWGVAIEIERAIKKLERPLLLKSHRVRRGALEALGPGSRGC